MKTAAYFKPSYIFFLNVLLTLHLDKVRKKNQLDAQLIINKFR